MPKRFLIDELHVAFYVRRGLPDAAYDEIRQVLNDARFGRQLRRAIKKVIRQYPALGEVHLAIAR